MDLTYTWYGSSSPCLGLLPSSRCLCLDILLCHTCDKVQHNDIKCLCLDDITYVTLCDTLPLPHNRSEEAKGMCANCVRNKKRQQIVSFLSFIREETEKNAFGAWERTVARWRHVRRTSPLPPSQEWHGVWLVLYVHVCKGYY